jgi:hypothetical protein
LLEIWTYPINKGESSVDGFVILRSRHDELADLPHADFLEDATRFREEAKFAPAPEPPDIPEGRDAFKRWVLYLIHNHPTVRFTSDPTQELRKKDMGASMVTIVEGRDCHFWPLSHQL